VFSRGLVQIVSSFSRSAFRAASFSAISLEAGVSVLMHCVPGPQRRRAQPLISLWKREICESSLMIRSFLFGEEKYVVKLILKAYNDYRYGVYMPAL